MDTESKVKTVLSRAVLWFILPLALVMIGINGTWGMPFGIATISIGMIVCLLHTLMYVLVALVKIVEPFAPYDPDAHEVIRATSERYWHVSAVAIAFLYLSYMAGWELEWSAFAGCLAVTYLALNAVLSLWDALSRKSV